MRRRYLWVLLFSVLVAGCCKSKSDGDSAPSKGKPGDITITMGDDGGVRVGGGKKMTGSAKDCAAFRACCTAPEASLFCGLTEASGQPCDVAVRSVRSFLAEKNAALPAGCK